MKKNQAACLIKPRGWPLLSVVAAAGLAAGSAAYGQIVLTVGSWDVTSGSTLSIDFFAINQGANRTVESLDFSIETPLDGPTIQSVNLLVGTPFEADNFGGQSGDPGNTSHIQYFGVLQNPGVVGSPTLLGASGSTKVATVVLNAAGIVPGPYALKLTGTAAGNTDYNIFVTSTDIPPLGMTVNNGFVNVTGAAVPEPAEMALGTGLILVAFGAWRRFRK